MRYIYQDLYSGWYCVYEERYWTEKDLTPDGGCPDCGRPVRQIEEKNYFFRMSRFQDALLEHLAAHPEWIVPASRQNEVLGFLQQPLSDLSISRPRSRLSWGIPLPFDSDHVAYVWVDALVNYITASGAIDPDAPAEEQGFEDVGDSWWPADLHIMGKDILTYHAVYWPTLLMAAGLPLPRRILAHGWWVVGQSKMSKSLDNAVDPLELRAEFGTDAVRWYLMREMPTGSDASYTPERFLARYGELANVLGNLASRTVSMVGRYRDGIVGKGGRRLDDDILRAMDTFASSMNALKIHEALEAAMELARKANAFVETSEPWALAKADEGDDDLDAVLATLVRALAALTALLFPVMPRKMEELAGALGLEAPPTLAEAAKLDPAGLQVGSLAPLFPRKND